MNKELQDIASVLLDLNDNVNKQVFTLLDLQRLNNTLKKINLKTASLSKLIDRLYLMDLACDDDKVIDLLIAIHRNFSQSIARVYAIRRLTTKIIRRYEDEWNKIYRENKSE